jgi:GH24 family phage-related lysozyme (muramidase)
MNIGVTYAYDSSKGSFEWDYTLQASASAGVDVGYHSKYGFNGGYGVSILGFSAGYNTATGFYFNKPGEGFINAMGLNADTSYNGSGSDTTSKETAFADATGENTPAAGNDDSGFVNEIVDLESLKDEHVSSAELLAQQAAMEATSGGTSGMVAPGKGTMSAEGLKALAKWEGNVIVGGKHVIYDDATKKPITSFKEGATIGYGHLITSELEFAKYKNGINETKALALLNKDVAASVLAVNESLKVSVTQTEFDAAVSLAFNIGNPSFKISSALKLMNNPNATTSYSSLESAWKAWNKGTIDGVKQVIPGLNNRRSYEWIYRTTGKY